MLAAVRKQQTVWRRHTKIHKPRHVGAALGHQSTTGLLPLRGNAQRRPWPICRVCQITDKTKTRILIAKKTFWKTEVNLTARKWEKNSEITLIGLPVSPFQRNISDFLRVTTGTGQTMIM